jgi:ubiquinone/menaquinone biosynthesis C-methylase UbiE
MSDYYSEKLAAERLRRCYDVAPPRVCQYLKAEIDHVLSRIPVRAEVLELGCGYGRVLAPLAARAGMCVGIDTSMASLKLARQLLGETADCHLICMDAARMAFRDRVFDVVVCIQNGISAFHRDQQTLIAEAIRVTRPGGLVLFSTYAERFWPHRLEWFEAQSHEGLLGEIDYEQTGNGVIVCKDGFTATTVSAGQFQALADACEVPCRLLEVDDSSLFCEITTGH